VLRLEETAIGAALAAIAALIVFPVPTRSAAAIALEHYVDALSRLLDRAAARLSGDRGSASATGFGFAITFTSKKRFRRSTTGRSVEP
jgi:uncharacterized membrane protein YccC